MMTIQYMRVKGQLLLIAAELADPAVQVSAPQVNVTEGSVDVYYTTHRMSGGVVAQVIVETQLEVDLPEGAEVGPRAYHVHVNGQQAHSIRI